MAQMFYFASVVILLVSALLVVSSVDFEIETQERDLYCEMTAIWASDSHLPPAERNGWPPYNKSINCTEG